MQKYDAVGFDYGGVIKGLPGPIFTEKTCRLLRISKEQYRKVYYRHHKRINRGEVTWEEFWVAVLSELGQPERVADVMALSDTIFGGDVHEEILLLADGLRKKGYKTGVLSNNTQQAADSMHMLGIYAFFDVVHVSAETGFVKPEPAAFRYFAEALNCNVSRMVFIDDSEPSLSTSTEVGYTPLLFKSYSGLVEQLRQLKIL